MSSKYSREMDQFSAKHSVTVMFSIFPAQAFYQFIEFFSTKLFYTFPSRNYEKLASYKEDSAKMWVSESFR